MTKFNSKTILLFCVFGATLSHVLAQSTATETTEYLTSEPTETTAESSAVPTTAPPTTAPPTTTEAPPTFKCPTTPLNARYPDPDDCTSFYLCDSGIAYHYNCGFPLCYRIETEECDWPGVVDCGTRPIPQLQ